MKKKQKSGAVDANELANALEAELQKAEQAFAAGLRPGVHVSCKSQCKSVKVA
ncbi:MAG: hypothetical protein ABW321_14895 [Polyangiales bacterium]